MSADPPEATRCKESASISLSSFKLGSLAMSESKYVIGTNAFGHMLKYWKGGHSDRAGITIIS